MLPTELPERYMPVTTLGNPVQVYVLPTWRLAIRVVFILALLGGGCTFLTLQIMGSKELQGTGWFFGPALVVAALAVGWGTHRRVRASAMAYENGFAHSDGGEVRTYRYDDIASFRADVTVYRSHGIPVYTSHQYPIEMKSGDRVVLKGYVSNVADLAKRIREAIFPLLLPRYVESYNRGEVLEFGPVRIGKELGVEVKAKPIAWSEIEKFGVGQGYLSINRRGKGLFRWSNVAASSIPNLDILMAIINQLLSPVGPPGPQ